MLFNQNHRDIYNLLFEKKTELNKDNFKWDEIIKTGSSHLVLPLIKYKIEKLKTNCPNDIKKYLDYINHYNKQRNLKLVIELNIINKIFKKIKVDYLILKGSALLLGGYFKDISNRMVGDIDILIKEEDYKKCKKNLELIGYESSKNYNLLNHRHYPRLINDKKYFALELHTELLRDGYRNLLPAKKIFKDKINTKYNIHIPSNKHLLLHAIYNQQINDYGFLKCSYDFRSLYDIYLLKENMIIENIVKSKYLMMYSLIKNAFENKDLNIKRNCNYKIYKTRLLVKSNIKLYRKIDKLLVDQLILNKQRLKLIGDIIKNKDLRKNTVKRIFRIK